MFVCLLVPAAVWGIQVNDTNVSTSGIGTKKLMCRSRPVSSPLCAGATAHSGSLCSSSCTSVSLASTSSSVWASLVGAPGEKTDQDTKH